MAAKKKPETPAPAEDALASVTLDQCPLADLHEWPENPRVITDLAVKKVAASIQRFGFVNPIVARLANKQIICGHTRFQAAKSLALTHAPVRFLDISAEEARALALADNRTSEETDWDEGKLAEIFKEMREKGEDLTSLGFDTFELADALRVKDELDIGAPRIDRVEEVEAFRFRQYKIGIPKELGEQFEQRIVEFAESRGTTNGFVEHIIAAFDAAMELEKSDAAEPEQAPPASE